jgi:hypothetical protein
MKSIGKKNLKIKQLYKKLKVKRLFEDKSRHSNYFLD